MRKQSTRAFTLVLALGLALMVPGPVSAAPPANDQPTAPTVISSLPFNDSLDVSEATTGIAEPSPYMCGQVESTVWYSYTFSGFAKLRIDTAGSDFYTVIATFTTPGLSLISCAAYGEELTITTPPLSPTVLIMVGRQAWTGTNSGLVVNVDDVPPPANDDFDAAVEISAFPFEEYVDPSLATPAADDPLTSCDGNAGPTIWFQTTPGDHPMELHAGSDVAAVYTGVRGELVEVACDRVPTPTAPAPAATTGGVDLFWDADAGVTYYIMLVGNQLNYVRVNTALTADLLITATMVAPKTGVVTIYGVLTCSKLASFSYVTANLVQKTGRFTNDGSGSSQSLECVPEGTVWQLTIESENPFVGGRGDLSLRADAYAWPQFAQATYDGTVTLKGGHH